MTRDDDGDRIGAVGHAYSADGFQVIDSPGEFEITDRFAVRDASQFLPHAVLKLRTRECDRCRKLLQPPGEILIQFLTNILEHTLRIRLPRRIDLARA